MITFRGIEVADITYSLKNQLYDLWDEDGTLIASITPYEYQMNVQLKQLRMSKHGRYRKSSAAPHSSPLGQPSHRPGGVTCLSALPTGFPDPEHFSAIPYAGIRAGEIVGQRCWRYDGHRLYSVYRTEYRWEPGEPMKGLNLRPGVHAFKHQISSYLYAIESAGGYLSFPFSSPDEMFIVGTVSMWGEVMEHTGGWRSEYAKVRTIDNAFSLSNFFLSNDHMREGLLRMLRRQYKVGVDRDAWTGDFDDIRRRIEHHVKGR